MRLYLASLAAATILFTGCTADPSGNSSSTGSETSPPTGDWQTTDSGLKYRVVTEGTGARPAAQDMVSVHYRGWLPNETDPSQGEEFDSSLGGDPISFPLNRVIPGWTEGLQLVGEGGKIELEIPSELGYGSGGTPDGAIPPDATLRFVVELLDVESVEVPEPVVPGQVDADAPEEFTTTDSGLKYRIRRKGNGQQPNPTDVVTVHYRGWLPDETDPSTGTVFDGSYQRGEPTSFPLNRVIPGWTEGLQLVSVGGMVELEIPSELAYQEAGTPDGAIPPNATLRFLVELLSIEGADNF